MWLHDESKQLFSQVYDPSTAYLGAPVFYAPQAYAAIPGQFRFPAAKAHVGGRGLIRTPSVRGEDGWILNYRKSMLTIVMKGELTFTQRNKSKKHQLSRVTRCLSVNTVWLWAPQTAVLQYSDMNLGFQSKRLLPVKTLKSSCLAVSSWKEFESFHWAAETFLHDQISDGELIIWWTPLQTCKLSGPSCSISTSERSELKWTQRTVVVKTGCDTLSAVWSLQLILQGGRWNTEFNTNALKHEKSRPFNFSKLRCKQRGLELSDGQFTNKRIFLVTVFRTGSNRSRVSVLLPGIKSDRLNQQWKFVLNSMKLLLEESESPGEMSLQQDRCAVTMTTAVPVHSGWIIVWLCDSSSGWFPVIWLISLPFRFPVEIYMTVPVGAAGVRGLGGRGYLAYTAGGGVVGRGGSGGASYSLKADKQVEEKLYDLLPGMELTPMNPAAMSLKAAAIKPAPQVTGHTWEGT